MNKEGEKGKGKDGKGKRGKRGKGKGFRNFAYEFLKEIFWNKIRDGCLYCALKCKVIPFQRISSTPYSVWTMIQKQNPGSKIVLELTGLDCWAAGQLG